MSDEGTPRLDLSDRVALLYHSLKKTAEGSAGLMSSGANEMKGPSEVGTGEATPDKVAPSELITPLNDRFGTNFTEADQAFFDGVRAEAVKDVDLQLAARANSLENFSIVYKKKEQETAIDRMDKNRELVEKRLNDDQFRAAISVLAGNLPSGRQAPGGVASP